jgi:ABC-type polysaccharide/polyol phosphate transport system ATPase subunit
MLELGAGFDTELTGRENVYLNGAILGYRRADVAERFERIVEFAGLQDFIDAPLRTYSSGMMARLGFAVATDVTPEILIVDEVMAVGDAEFRRKSTERMEQIRASGATVLMVSHDLAGVRSLCTRAVWLDHGHVRAVGAADDVVAQYEAAAGQR